jgi:hypothetical protein
MVITDAKSPKSSIEALRKAGRQVTIAEGKSPPEAPKAVA